MKKKVLELKEKDVAKLQCQLIKLRQYLLDDYHASDDHQFYEDFEKVEKLYKTIKNSEY